MESTKKIKKGQIDFQPIVEAAKDWVKLFGLGTTVPNFTGDVFGIEETSFKYASTAATNKPNGENGFIFTQALSTTNKVQIFFDLAGLRKVWYNVMVGGTSQWNQLPNSGQASTLINSALSVSGINGTLNFTGDVFGIAKNSFHFASTLSTNKPTSDNGFVFTQYLSTTTKTQIFFSLDAARSVYYNTCIGGVNQWNRILNKSQIFDTANAFTVSPSTIPATQTNHVPQFGQIPTNEHQLPGNRITASITGTYAIDWNAGSQFILTPTGAVTLSDANLPVAPNTKVISGRFSASANAVTFPASWKAKAGNDPLSATLATHFTAETFPTYVLYTLENIPA